MIAGHLQIKKDRYYAVLTYSDSTGQRRTKWISTGLGVKGNKKRAEELLLKARQEFVQDEIPVGSGMFFSDFMKQWLEIARTTVKPVTYASYCKIVNNNIVPYFQKRKITLEALTASDIQTFYLEQLKRVSANTVIHFHANIHKALKYAVKMDLLDVNPADKVERPKKADYQGSYYSAEEIKQLFEVVKDTHWEIPVYFGLFYGLRRAEVVGMRWEAIDFRKNIISVKHTVTSCSMSGKYVLLKSDSTKTKSSMRTLPLVDTFKERLLALKAQQEENQRLCGKSYNKEYLGYICVDEMGNLVRPQYLTTGFPNMLVRHGLRRIRWHDLRHSCASMLVTSGVNLKRVQLWLGHSDMATTANIYTHLEFEDKLVSAEALLQGLSEAGEE